MKKPYLILSVVFNLATAILVALAVGSFFTTGGAGNMDVAGTRCFRYFTIDSNVLAGIVSLASAYFSIRSLRGGEGSAWADRLKYVGTVAVAVTFLTVVFFLGPTQGYAKMFSGATFPLHLVCPLLAIISFVFLDSRRQISLRETLLGLIPTALYGIVYLIMVLIIGWQNGGWVDFYGFNRGGMWYISMPAMLIATWVISYLLSLGRRIFREK